MNDMEVMKQYILMRMITYEEYLQAGKSGVHNLQYLECIVYNITIRNPY